MHLLSFRSCQGQEPHQHTHQQGKHVSCKVTACYQSLTVTQQDFLHTSAAFQQLLAKPPC